MCLVLGEQTTDVFLFLFWVFCYIIIYIYIYVYLFFSSAGWFYIKGIYHYDFLEVLSTWRLSILPHSNEQTSRLGGFCAAMLDVAREPGSKFPSFQFSPDCITQTLHVFGWITKGTANKCPFKMGCEPLYCPAVARRPRAC